MSQSSGLQALAQLWGQAGRLSDMPVNPHTLQLHEVMLASAARLCAGTKGNCRSRASQSRAARQEGFSLRLGRNPVRVPQPAPPRWTHPRGTLSYLFSVFPALHGAPPALHAAPHTQKTCCATRSSPAAQI